MSVNTQIINAPVERIFEVLADGSRYEEWVVGAKQIRRVDPSWPSAGSEFHHSIGAGPIGMDDSTSVQEVEAPLRLELEVRIRPLLVADVVLEIEPLDDHRSRVVMREEIKQGILSPVRWAVGPLLSVRNAESLRRLRKIVENGKG